MDKSKVLISLVVILCLLFVVFQFNEVYRSADVARALIVPIISILYFINKSNKSAYFTLFMLAFSISELLIVFNLNVDLEYFVGNSLYIIAYLALSYEIILSINLRHIYKHFKMHIFVLLILNIYVNYVLVKIETEYIYGIEFQIELLYNIFTLLLLSVSLLNYFYRDDKKALLLFLGSLCITVSEVIQIAYFYISEKDLLNVSYSLLLILAFYFFYYQSKLEYEEVLVLA